MMSELLNFIGHSDENDELDDLMNLMGFSTRPKGVDSLAYIWNKEKSIALEFSSRDGYLENFGIAPISDGAYILAAVDIDAKYKGELPFGLKLNSQRSELNVSFGTVLEEDGDYALLHSAGKTIVLRYGPQKKIKSLKFGMLDKYEREHFGL